MEIVDHTIFITIKRNNKLEKNLQLYHKQTNGKINHSEEIEFQKSFQESSESEIQNTINFNESTQDFFLREKAFFEAANDVNRSFQVLAPTMTVTKRGVDANK